MACRMSAYATSSRQSRYACVWAGSMARLALCKNGPAWISRDSYGVEARGYAGAVTAL